LSSRARLTKAERAWIYIDVGNSAFATTVLATLFPIFFTNLIPEGGVELIPGSGVHSLAISIWGYAVSISALGTLFVSLLVGSWADRYGLRRACYLVLSLMGAAATLSLCFLESWQSLIVAFMIANVGFAGGIVFSNSLLKFVTTEGKWDSLSLKAYAWGYIAGGLMLAFNLAFIMKPSWFGLADAAAGTRLSFLLVGIWWLIWSLPAYFRIVENKESASVHKFSLFGQIKSLTKTIRELPARPVLLWFILSYFFSNEGIQTVIAMATPFAKETLQLDQTHIIGTFLIIQILGFPLTLLMTKFATRWGPIRILKAAFVFWIVIIAFAFSMTTSVHFLILGLLVAVVLGVSQAIPRSLYARLIPAGKEAEYYSLYGLSGRSNPVLGPLIFGLIADISSDSRIAILSLGIFFVLGLVPLHFVGRHFKSN